MATTIPQRAVDLAYAGHPPSEIANLLGISENTVRGYLQDITKAPGGGVAPSSVNQRAVDLAHAGLALPVIANETGLSENAIRALLQDVTQVPSSATTGLVGASGTVAPAAGAAAALPATPKGYLTVRVNGAAQQIPYY